MLVREDGEGSVVRTEAGRHQDDEDRRDADTHATIVLIVTAASDDLFRLRLCAFVLTEHKACHVEGSGSHVGVRGTGYRVGKCEKVQNVRLM